MKEVIIVGGGISGLTTAHYINKFAKEKNVDVHCTILEGGENFGGKIFTIRDNGLAVEKGPDSFLSRKTPMLNLCEELGIAHDYVQTSEAASKYFILHNNKLMTLPKGTMLGIPSNVFSFALSPLIGIPAKARALFDLVLPRSSKDYVADQSLGKFLKRRLGHETIENVIEPIVAGIYASHADDLSLKCTFPQFEDMEKKYRSLIVGTFYGLKKLEGVKKDKTTFLSLRHGLSTIIEKEVEEAKKAGYDLHLNSKVTNFEKTDDNKYVVTAGDKKYQGDNVVFAIQNYETDELVKKYIDMEDLLNTEYVSVAIVILFYKKEEIKNKLDASGFVIPQNENKFITACTWFSKKWPHSSSDDVVLRAFVGRKGDDRFMSMTDDEIIANVKKDLSDIMEVDATPIRIIVSRVEKSMPQYVVGHLDKVANFKQKLAEKLKGVYSLGAGHTAIGMPDSVAMAKEVAEKILS